VKQATPWVFVSYSHDSTEHRGAVEKFVRRLEDAGFVCIYDGNGAPESGDWISWMRAGLDLADFVVIVCSAGYRERWRIRQHCGEIGRGVKFEGATILQEIYSRGMWNVRFIPVLLGDSTVNDILEPLRHYTFYRAEDELGFLRLKNRLMGARVHVPGVGITRLLPPEG
jgi:hypothetical protein